MSEVVGIAAEYNPFHNGHAFHIESVKCGCSPSAVVVAMSGSFTQRGEAAVADKYVRARAAVEAGADLVVQLPVYFSVKPAELFAKAAVKIFSSLGVSCISFGVETQNPQILAELAGLLSNEPMWFKVALGENLKKGLSFPAAVASALPDFKEILSYPNNVLALEYIKAAGAGFSTFPVTRVGAAHDSDKPEGEFASATFIRRLLKEGHLDYAAQFMPHYAFELLRREVESGCAPSDFDSLESALLLRLRQIPEEQLAFICDVSEGLERRIKKYIYSAVTLEKLVCDIKCKRYTRARIMRVLTSCFLGLKKGISPEDISYVHPLAFNQTGASLLKASKLPVVYRKCDVTTDSEALVELDSFADDCFCMMLPSSRRRAFGSYFSRAPVVFK